MKISLLVDRGYMGDKWLLTSKDMTSQQKNDVHKEFRSTVEKIIRLVKMWKIAGRRCRLSPGYQKVTLLIVYGLVASIVKELEILK